MFFLNNKYKLSFCDKYILFLVINIFVIFEILLKNLKSTLKFVFFSNAFPQSKEFFKCNWNIGSIYYKYCIFSIFLYLLSILVCISEIFGISYTFSHRNKWVYQINYDIYFKRCSFLVPSFYGRENFLRGYMLETFPLSVKLSDIIILYRDTSRYQVRTSGFVSGITQPFYSCCMIISKNWVIYVYSINVLNIIFIKMHFFVGKSKSCVLRSLDGLIVRVALIV